MINPVDQAIADWHNLQAELNRIKELEMQARQRVISMLYKRENVGSTQTLELGAGYKLKMKVPLHYGFKKESFLNDSIVLALQKIDAMSNREMPTDELVRWKPELSVRVYKTLPDKYRDIIDDVIISNEGAPSLELVEPK